MELGDLIVKIGADISDFESKMKLSSNAVESFNATTLATAAKVVGSFALVSAAMNTVISQATALASAAGQAAEQLDIVATQTGISTTNLQGYEVLLNRSKLGIDDLALSFRGLSRSVQEAENPNSKAALRFRELGISLDGDRSPEHLLEKLADALQAMPDGFNKTALATELLSRAGMRLLPVLNQGSEALRQAREDAERFGVVMSEEAVAKANRFDDAMDDLKIVMQGFSNQTGALVAGPMTYFVDKITAMIAGVNQLVKAMGDVNVAAKLGEVLSVYPAPSAMGPHNLKGPSAADAASMQEALGIVEPQLIARTSESLGGLLSKIRMMSEEYKGLAIVAHTSMFDAANEAGKKFGQHALGEFLTQKGIKQFKFMNEQDTRDLEGQVNREGAITDHGLADYKFNPNLGNRQIYSTRALQELVPEVGQEAPMLAAHNEDAALDVMRGEQMKHQLAQDNIGILQREMEVEASSHRLQAEFYANAPALFGQAEAARTAAFREFEMEERQKVAILQESARRGEITEAQSDARILILDQDMQAKRMATIRQYPTFFEQQMQAIVQSHSFSMAQISTQFTGTFAKWVVEGTKFKQFWVSLQESIVQSAMQSLMQLLAQFALSMTRQIALTEVTERAKTTIQETLGIERVAAQAVEQQAGVANAEASLAQMGALAKASGGIMEAVTVEIAAVFAAIGAALAASVVGAPFAPAFEAAAGAVIVGGTGAVVATQGAIDASISTAAGVIGATGIPKLATGGLVTGPTFAMVGEAGPEAVIPLDRLAGLSGGGPHTFIIELNGREIARSTLAELPRLVRMRGMTR